MEMTYIQPDNMQELKKALAGMTDSSRVLAGGTDLLIEMRNRHPQIDQLLDLSHVAELKGIGQDGGMLRIGAMTTHAEAAADDQIRHLYTGLAMACSFVGSQQIRNKGTLGGSLCNASPAGDIMPCVHLYHGEVELLGPSGTARMPISEFLLGNARVNKKKTEIISAIWLPIQEERESCFVKLGSRSEVSIAQISMALSWERQGDRVRTAEAWLGAVAEKPLWIEEAIQITEEPDILAARLSEQIRQIRLNRKRESKLKTTEAEKLYKERAVRGVVYDARKKMGEVIHRLPSAFDGCCC